jgi:hypothetical protein
VYNAYFVVVPQGQIISDTSWVDEGSLNDMWYWGSLFGNANEITSLAPGQTVNVQIYISPNFPGATTQPIKLGTKLSGGVWVMYSTASTANMVAEVAKFNAVAVIG